MIILNFLIIIIIAIAIIIKYSIFNSQTKYRLIKRDFCIFPILYHSYILSQMEVDKMSI